jgi:hypothetical protein
MSRTFRTTALVSFMLQALAISTVNACPPRQGLPSDWCLSVPSGGGPVPAQPPNPYAVPLAQKYRVICWVGQTSYCEFANPIPVTSGATCSCGRYQGITN